MSIRLDPTPFRPDGASLCKEHRTVRSPPGQSASPHEPVLDIVHQQPSRLVRDSYGPSVTDRAAARFRPLSLGRLTCASS